MLIVSGNDRSVCWLMIQRLRLLHHGLHHHGGDGLMVIIVMRVVYHCWGHLVIHGHGNRRLYWR